MLILPHSESRLHPHVLLKQFDFDVSSTHDLWDFPLTGLNVITITAFCNLTRPTHSCLHCHPFEDSQVTWLYQFRHIGTCCLKGDLLMHLEILQWLSSVLGLVTHRWIKLDFCLWGGQPSVEKVFWQLQGVVLRVVPATPSLCPAAGKASQVGPRWTLKDENVVSKTVKGERALPTEAFPSVTVCVPWGHPLLLLCIPYLSRRAFAKMRC